MNPRPHLFGVLAGLFLAAGLAVSAAIVASTLTRLNDSSAINVTGSARRNVRSDLIIWRANFSADAPTLLEAQRQLQADLAKVSSFLQLHGMTNVALAPVQIREITAKRRERSDDDDAEPQTVLVRLGYRLTQGVEISSSEVERVPRLAAESGVLLEQGVAFVSEGFQFIYTKAGEAKVEMMAEATKDARARAEQIAAQGNRRVDGLRNAKVGVVQINPLHSSATSWDGNNDTTSLDKTIIATVSASFAMK
ncbi:MAG: SIMPL domain-containing protein [Opitutae bacterium]|nr:SIMPL domain-containing protein [Opitutae bacterium]